MQKIEIKKSLEREIALLKLALVLVVLSTPSFLMNMVQVRIYVLLAMMFIAGTFFKRIKRLNYKLSLLSK